MVKSTYVIKIVLSKQFCSEKLLQIGKFTFQLLDLVEESDKELEKYSPFITAKNTVISPNFLVQKFCGKEQFPHSFGRFARNMRKLFLSTKFPHQEIS